MSALQAPLKPFYHGTPADALAALPNVTNTLNLLRDVSNDKSIVRRLKPLFTSLAAQAVT